MDKTVELTAMAMPAN